jgi:hypothetical protein
VLQFNKETTPQDITYVGDGMLKLCFTTADRAKTIQQLRWLNDTLTQLGMSDRVYALPANLTDSGSQE